MAQNVTRVFCGFWVGLYNSPSCIANIRWQCNQAVNKFEIVTIQKHRIPLADWLTADQMNEWMNWWRMPVELRESIHARPTNFRCWAES